MSEQNPQNPGQSAGLAVSRLTSQFEGTDLVTYLFQGRPCWIARDVGVALGYENEGKRFVEAITSEWADEFVEGVDFAKLIGKDLRDFKKLTSLSPESGLSRAPSILVLFEPGVMLACIKTDKPAGKKLRRFLSSEVLPQIAKTGKYEAPAVKGKPSQSAEMRDRQFRAKFLRDTVKDLRDLKGVNDDVCAVMLVKAAEIATGMSLPALLPKTETTWVTPTQIGAPYGITGRRVGDAISALGASMGINLRGNVEGLSRCVLNKSEHSDRTVESYQYTPKAAQMIEEKIREMGIIPKAVA